MDYVDRLHERWRLRPVVLQVIGKGAEIRMARVQGYVHIVESPSATDLLDGRTEGRLLGEALQLCGIPYLYNLAVGKSVFQKSFGERVVVGLKKHKMHPILHLSTHGNSDGIGLTDGTILNWADLRELIAPVSNAATNGMLLCMSTCYGANAGRIVETIEQVKLYGVVGSRNAATWPESAIAYAAFYHRFFAGATLAVAVEAMKIASGHDGFELMDKSRLNETWQNYMTQTLSDLIESLQQSGVTAP